MKKFSEFDTNENSNGLHTELLKLDLEYYEVDSTTLLETMGASAGVNSCSAIIKTVG